MKDLFISNERKVSTVPGTGIQYIPGHIEPFVDLIIKNYLPEEKNLILDLGGGGLRFAIPVAMSGKKITVVDLDPSGIDLELICRRISEIGEFKLPDINLLRENIQMEMCNCFDYLEKASLSFSMITAFRLIHFFNEQEIVRFFQLVSKRIISGGRVFISAFSMYNSDDNKLNEIYLNSEAVGNNNFCRKFFPNDSALALQNSQNLSGFFHVFTSEYLKEFGQKVNLKMELGNLESTRIVKGYIFIKE